MSIGISAAGVYLPRSRLLRKCIADAHAWAMPALQHSAGGRISAANWDEDCVTMGHEAARRTIGAAKVTSLGFCSTSLPFADRSHASLLVESLDLGAPARTQDLTASARAATSALLSELSAGNEGSLVIASEKRLAKPASPQEIGQGDAAAAFLTGGNEKLATFLCGSSVSADFVDHYRASDEQFDYYFEDRWIRDEGVLALLPTAIEKLLSESGIARESISRFTLNTSAPVRKKVAAAAGLKSADTSSALDTEVGNAGCATPLLQLAEALDTAKKNDTILCACFGQGVDLLLFRATGKTAGIVDQEFAKGKDDENYLRYLSHRRLLELDWGKRAERDVRTAQSAYYRVRRQISAFIGGQCVACNTVQFPKSRACVNPACREFSDQTDYPMANLTGTVKSFTEDWQAYSPAPPLVYGNVVFEGGSNVLMQFTDHEAGTLNVGDKVTMHFRIKDFDRARGFRRYFWKAIKVSD